MKNQLFNNISNSTCARINYINKNVEFDFSNIKKALLSVDAQWSVYSFNNGRSILNLIDNLSTKDFEIYIFDIEAISTEQQIKVFGANCNGYFESVWIENGEIVFKYRDNNKTTELNKFKGFLLDNLK